jgi:putative oxidoreductase
MAKLIDLISNTYVRGVVMLNWLKSPLLLAIRLYWGWQFGQDGWGKLNHLDKVGEYFASLNLPMPAQTALAVALIELVGGVLLALGVGTRLVSLVLFVNMTVAFWTAEKEAFLGVFSAPDKFQSADAYNYWFAALLILVLGPGWVAVDTLIGHWLPEKNKP